MSVILRNVLFSTWHGVKRDGVNEAVRELERNQWLSTAELLELQQEKLHGLLTTAAKNVPYYQRILHELKNGARPPLSETQFQQVPPLTKSIIRQEKDALISKDLAGNGLRSNSTSGSTGEATRFFTDFRSLPYRQASLLRSDAWTGWKPGEKVVRIWGAPIDASKATSLRGKVHGLITGSRFLSSFELSESDMDRYVRTIQSFKPVLLVAYPGPLEQFAIHCRDRNVGFPSLRAIVSSSETLWPHQRGTIEQTFGVRIFDRYGSREVAHIASECAEHDGLHISVDRLLVEVVDEVGQPCAPGVVGNILITDLDNIGMPLIRYAIEDRGAMAQSGTCNCGRGLPLLEKVEGRTMEIVRTPDGRRVGGTFWTFLLKSRPGIRQFQIVQDNLNGIVINFIRDSNFDEAMLSYFKTRIQQYCGKDFGVEFVEQSTIDLTNSGKRRLIVSNLSDEPPGRRPANEGR